MSHSNASPCIDRGRIPSYETIGLAILVVANRHIHIQIVYFVKPTNLTTVCLDVPLFL
jgi:hypothetical protein